MCRADAKNREARAELAAVTATLKARREEEKKAYGSMFSGKSMYREEELREKRKLEEVTPHPAPQPHPNPEPGPGPNPSPEPNPDPHPEQERQAKERERQAEAKLKQEWRNPSPSPSPNPSPNPSPRGLARAGVAQP